MPSGRHSRSPPLTRIKHDHEVDAGETHSARERDWSVLMARAQDGDRAAYRRLLEEITPFLRALAARRHRDLSDAEDAIQDVLLTLHATRHTYDPARPFGPWLVAIANHRLIDRLRRQGRLRSRETALMPEHETFSADQPNLCEKALDRRNCYHRFRRARYDIIVPSVLKAAVVSFCSPMRSSSNHRSGS